MGSKLFGSSGIRGVVNLEITPLLAMQAGSALASIYKGGLFTVGRDSRLTGRMLQSGLISGLISCGAHVKTLGVVPTPTVAYLTRVLGGSSGVSITASHNPAEYNGLKFFDSSGMSYTEDKQCDVERIMLKSQFSLKGFNEIGDAEEVHLEQLYIDSILSSINIRKKLSIICEIFNGATGVVLPKLLKLAGYDYRLLNCQPDGRFMSGSPEPTRENLQRLAALVKEKGADLGFGFDGDGDRMVVVDERGAIPSPDRVLAAYARHVVEKAGGGIIVTHVGASMCVDEVVNKAGGKTLRTKVGDVSIAESIKKNGALFGGEPVGAWIHPSVHMCPDGLLSAFKLIEALEEEGGTLSKFLEGVPQYYLLEEKIDCQNRLKSSVSTWISQNHRKFISEDVEINLIDGIRLDLEKGWILIRPSGTEPVIRATVEAHDLSEAERLLEIGRRLIHTALEVQ
ncbi:phosphoglucosamine mutase [Candidatus Bathyarchaeota archaeon]|nr:phosphoglucosamine mutase [Candidatus Bathyarchaeota archaeon]